MVGDYKSIQILYFYSVDGGGTAEEAVIKNGKALNDLQRMNAR